MADDGGMSAPIAWADSRGSHRMSDVPPAVRKFVRDWGDLGERWGLDRGAAEAHAILWVAPDPMDMRDVASTLGVDPDEAARRLETLRERGLAQLADRDSGTLRYTVPRDPVAMFRAIVDDRIRRELDPAVASLRDAVLRADSDATCDDATRARLEALQTFLRESLGFYRQLSTMPTPQVRRLLKFGSRIRRALGLAN